LNLLDEIVREWARTAIQQKDVLNYNGANLAYNHAADIANKLGLSATQKLGVTPFPQSNVSSNVQVTDQTSLAGSLLSRLLPVALGAALGGGGIGLGMMLAGRAIAPPSPPPPAIVAPPAQGQGDVDFSIQGFLPQK